MNKVADGRQLLSALFLEKGKIMKLYDNLNCPEIELFTKFSENQLAHIYEPKQGLFIAESIKVLERALAGGYVPECALVEDKVYDEVSALLINWPEVRIMVAPFEVLKELTGYHMTGGVLCAMKRKTLPSLMDIAGSAKRLALLEDVVNPTNIGAIFRNAAALNIDGVLLSPGCCDPLYKRAIRVSMGTVFQIPWTFVNCGWPKETMNELKNMGFAAAAMALDSKAISIKNEKLRAEEKLVILLGSEGNGLTDETLAHCDYTVMIPMSHNVDSLNVAAASALAFWELA